MRVTFFLRFKDFTGTVSVQPDYRIKIFSFIKELIKQSHPVLRDTLWGNDKKVNCVKPFTFSCYFPGITSDKDTLIAKSDKLHITVSFGNYVIPGLAINGYEIFFALYNGLIQQKKNLCLYLNDKAHYLSLIRAVTHREKLLIPGDNVITFKTCTPFLVRKITPNKKPEWLGIDDSEFGEWIEKSVVSLAKQFLGKDEFSLEFKPLKCKTVFLNHYNSLVKGTSGTFVLNTPGDVIKLVYDVGLGAKRNEGFGMVEVVG